MKNVTLTLVLLSSATVSFLQKTKFSKSIKELTDSIEVIVKQEHITGLMLGITTKDSVLFSGGFGYADLEIRRQVIRDSTKVQYCDGRVILCSVC